MFMQNFNNFFYSCSLDLHVFILLDFNHVVQLCMLFQT
jgi:hypothetical protein